jgi:hypothetical protein
MNGDNKDVYDFSNSTKNKNNNKIVPIIRFVLVPTNTGILIKIKLQGLFRDL